MDPQRFVSYYVNQAGGGTLPGFRGAPFVYSQSGRGLGWMSRAFRFVLPFLKRGVNIVKPHLEVAAKGAASDLLGAVTNRIIKGSSQKDQEGSGIARLVRGRKRKSVNPLLVISSKNKRRRISSKRRRVKPQLGGNDIF